MWIENDSFILSLITKQRVVVVFFPAESTTYRVYQWPHSTCMWISCCYWLCVRSSGRCPPERTALRPWWRLRWLSGWRTQTGSCEWSFWCSEASWWKERERKSNLRGTLDQCLKIKMGCSEDFNHVLTFWTFGYSYLIFNSFLTGSWQSHYIICFSSGCHLLIFCDQVTLYSDRL